MFKFKMDMSEAMYLIDELETYRVPDITRFYSN